MSLTYVLPLAGSSAVSDFGLVAGSVDSSGSLAEHESDLAQDPGECLLIMFFF